MIFDNLVVTSFECSFELAQCRGGVRQLLLKYKRFHGGGTAVEDVFYLPLEAISFLIVYSSDSLFREAIRSPIR